MLQISIPMFQLKYLVTAIVSSYISGSFKTFWSKSRIDSLFLCTFSGQIAKSSLNCKQNRMPAFNQKCKIYEVQEILDEAVIQNEPHYLIKWENHPHQYDTWQPLSNLANIADYLGFWLKQRNRKVAKSKDKQKVINYHTVRDYVGRDHLQPKTKSVRDQYAEELQLERKKEQRERFGKKLLNRPKIWEKYIEQDQKCIDLIDSDEEYQTNQQSAYNQKVKDTFRSSFDQPVKMQEKIAVKSAKIQQEQTNERILKYQQTQKLKVICAIDTTQITKICKIFDWSGITCVQIEMASGKHYNMTYEEVKQYQAQLLRQFQMKNTS